MSQYHQTWAKRCSFEKENRVIFDLSVAGSFAPNEDFRDDVAGSFAPDAFNPNEVAGSFAPQSAEQVQSNTREELKNLQDQMGIDIPGRGGNAIEDIINGEPSVFGAKIDSLAKSFFGDESNEDGMFNKKMMGLALIAGILSIFNRGGAGREQLMSADGQYEMDGNILPEAFSDPFGGGDFIRMRRKQEYETDILFTLRTISYDELTKQYGERVEDLSKQLDDPKIGYARRDVLEQELMEARDRSDVLKDLRAQRIQQLRGLDGFFGSAIRDQAKSLRDFPDAQDIPDVPVDDMTPLQRQTLLWRAGANIAMQLAQEGQFVMDPDTLQFSYEIVTTEPVDALIEMEQEFYRLAKIEDGVRVPFIENMAALWQQRGSSLDLVHPITQQRFHVSQHGNNAYRFQA